MPQANCAAAHSPHTLLALHRARRGNASLGMHTDQWEGKHVALGRFRRHGLFPGVRTPQISVPPASPQTCQDGSGTLAFPTCVPRSGLDQRVSRLYNPRSLRVFHHPQADAVLHAAPRVEVLAFCHWKARARLHQGQAGGTTLPRSSPLPPAAIREFPKCTPAAGHTPASDPSMPLTLAVGLFSPRC